MKRRNIKNDKSEALESRGTWESERWEGEGTNDNCRRQQKGKNMVSIGKEGERVGMRIKRVER